MLLGFGEEAACDISCLVVCGVGGLADMSISCSRSFSENEFCKGENSGGLGIKESEP